MFKKGSLPRVLRKPVFPTSEFTNYIVFSDHSDPHAWSHDTFARKLKFTILPRISRDVNALHILKVERRLLAHSHSCLDYPFSILPLGRKIQSVGTPYQGTNLAGSPALLATCLALVVGLSQI
jgi:hypothetical protein